MVNIFTDTIEIEVFGHLPLYLVFGIESLCALFMGGLIGIDRELKIKAAGLKTNIMICFGSMIFTAMSWMNLIGFDGTADPNRMSAQIVSGIGFLGAGAIMQGRGKNVTGLTTAATIWVVAAIGYTIGIGRPITALFYTLTVLVILNVVDPLAESLVNLRKRPFHLEVLSRGPVGPLVLGILKSYRIQVVFQAEEKNNEYPWTMFNAYVYTNSKILSDVQVEIQKLLKVKDASFHQLETMPDFPVGNDKQIA